jgi:hypothetical protein
VTISIKVVVIVELVSAVMAAPMLVAVDVVPTVKVEVVGVATHEQACDSKEDFST